MNNLIFAVKIRVFMGLLVCLLCNNMNKAYVLTTDCAIDIYDAKATKLCFIFANKLMSVPQSLSYTTRQGLGDCLFK